MIKRIAPIYTAGMKMVTSHGRIYTRGVKHPLSFQTLLAFALGGLLG
jgi:hypothetical protein